MIETGLDRAEAPDASTCLKAARSVGATWWNVYVGGGAFLAANGWTPGLVQSLAAVGFKFMATYVGEQSGGTLTADQGARDGVDAVAAMVAYGWQPGNPCCLDIECATYWFSPAGAIEYTAGWCSAVREAGYHPGVFSCPVGLIALAARGGLWLPDFVWLGDLVTTGPAPIDPHRAAGLPSGLWPGDGQRMWKYAGKGASAAELEVGISAADSACLAGAPSLSPTWEPMGSPVDLSTPLADAGLHAGSPTNIPDSFLGGLQAAVPASYTVRTGDSLASIADAYGMSWQTLWAMNRDRIANPNLIAPGEELRVETQPTRM